MELSALFEQEPDFEHLPDVHHPAPAPPKPARPAKAAKPRPAKAAKPPRSTTARPPRAPKPPPPRPAAVEEPSVAEPDAAEPDAVEPDAVEEPGVPIGPEPTPEPAAVAEPEAVAADDAATEVFAVVPAGTTALETAVGASAVIEADSDLDATTELRAIPEAEHLPDVEQTAVFAPVGDAEPPEAAEPAEPAADDGPPKRRRRRVTLALLGMVAVLFLIVGWSMGTALGKPVSESTSAKLAEWGRDHNLGPVVTWLEKEQYKLNPPRTGGKLAGGIQVGSGARPEPTLAAPTHATEPVHTTAPADLTPIVHDGLYPNEGVWEPLVSTPAGLPMVLGTAIRPDSTHTSYQVGVAWMDPKLVRFELHPGSVEPPGKWSTATTLGTPALETGLVSAFNAGFRLDTGDSRGGWYLDGTWAYPARVGAESFVIYKDGHADIGRWGSQVRMTAQVVAVRQNLDQLLLPGAGGTVTVNPSVDENNTSTWGYTLGAKAYVARSGVGVTRTGAIVYAAGLTSTRTLATVLRDAGCVRAMELDINPEWTIYTAFPRASGTTAQSPGPVTGTKLTPDEQAAADHFLTTSARDFFAVYAR